MIFVDVASKAFYVGGVEFEQLPAAEKKAFIRREVAEIDKAFSQLPGRTRQKLALTIKRGELANDRQHEQNRERRP